MHQRHSWLHSLEGKNVSIINQVLHQLSKIRILRFSESYLGLFNEQWAQLHSALLYLRAKMDD